MQRPQHHVVSLAHSMHHYPPLRLLSGGYLCWERDLDQIRSMLDCLTPDRLTVYLSSKSFAAEANVENWEKEPYYQTRAF